MPVALQATGMDRSCGGQPTCTRTHTRTHTHTHTTVPTQRTSVRAAAAHTDSRGHRGGGVVSRALCWSTFQGRQAGPHLYHSPRAHKARPGWQPRLVRARATHTGNGAVGPRGKAQGVYLPTVEGVDLPLARLLQCQVLLHPLPAGGKTTTGGGGGVTNTQRATTPAWQSCNVHAGQASNAIGSLVAREAQRVRERGCNHPVKPKRIGHHSNRGTSHVVHRSRSPCLLQRNTACGKCGRKGRPRGQPHLLVLNNLQKRTSQARQGRSGASRGERHVGPRGALLPLAFRPRSHPNHTPHASIISLAPG